MTTTSADIYPLHPIGFIRSTLRTRREAPCQGSEGAPDVLLDVLQVHPRRNPENPLTGVFFTRSPDRPNPLGLHRVTVREIAGQQLCIGPMEAIDGTPVVDIKAVLDASER
jgi:tRNA (Thr-GGU) A37 N-methylase